MTTRNDRAALKLVNNTTRKAIAGYSGWKFDFRQADADAFDALTRELTWVYGAGRNGAILNLSKKEVRPGLWELYCSSSEHAVYTLYKYSGLFTTEALEVFAHGWYLKYNG